MAVIAEQCPDVRVAVLDISAETIRGWNSNDLPISDALIDCIDTIATGICPLSDLIGSNI